MTRTSGQSSARTGTPRTSRPTGQAGGQTARPRKSASAKRWNRALSRTIKVAGIAGSLFIVVFGLLYVRLLNGPIPLTFLAASIQEAVQSEFSGLGVQIEDVAARLNESGTIEFELKNVRVSDAGGAPIAFAPSAALSLSSRALLAGHLAPESVDLIAPRLVLSYAEDGTLSVKFTPPTATPEVPGVRHTVAGGGTQSGLAVPEAQANDWTETSIDLVKALSEASASARRRERASAYLRAVGLRGATVIVDNGVRKTIWRVRDFDIDLDHRRSRSSIAGRARVESLTGPWELNFRTNENERNKTLQLAMSVQGLVPRGLARSIPQLAVLEGLDMPVWAEAQLDLSSAGKVLGGTIGIDTAPGTVSLPWLGGKPVQLDGGHFALAYNGTERRFDISPSVLVLGTSRLQFTGQIAHNAQGPEGQRWVYDLKSAGGWIGAEPPVHDRLVIDDWRARGHISPDLTKAVLSQFNLRAGGAEVNAQGDLADVSGALQARLEGRIGAMSAETFKSLWPVMLAPLSREWVGVHLVRGALKGGTFKIVHEPQAAGTDWTPTNSQAAGPNRVSLALEGSDVAVSIIEGWPALEMPRSLVRLENNSLEITSPDAMMTASDGRRLSLKGAMTVDMAEPLPRTGHFGFKLQGPLSLALEMVDQEPIRALQGASSSMHGIDGKLDGQLTVSLPLGKVPAAGEVKVEGKARVTDGRLKQAIGPYSVHGANINIDLTGTAVEASGDMLVNGVLAKASWQHVFAAAQDKQPPLRVMASLDNSDRTQLGFELNDLVQGVVGLEVLLSHNLRGERSVQVRADLADADLILDSVAWRKPRGRPSIFQFDVVHGGRLPTELHNVRLVGDNVAVEGWMGIDADNRLREFNFPQFSLNVVGSLSTEGRLRNDNVWQMTAKGTTYDGRDIFRSFFDVGRSPERAEKIRQSFELTADVDTVIGFSDTTLRKVRLEMHRRGSRMTYLNARGLLEGGKPFSATLNKVDGNQPRILRAEAGDAGLLFKVVGFYPNAYGGTMNLDVNLDAQGAADRVGTLWAHDFYVLGDPIVSEVLQNADGTGGQGRRTVVREKFEFDRMRIPFSIGHGQFVMNNAYLKGPVVGASVRGKIDFRSQRLDVGGTYVPLAGLSSALAPVPLLGPLLTGPRGEGIFGITFAIQGEIANPQVIVNPFALVTPGFLREIMQMTPEDPRVLPRDKAPARNDPAAPRSSSSGAKASGGGGTDIGAGWSGDSTEVNKTRKK